MIRLALLAAVCLAGCTTPLPTEPKTVTREVKVPVSIPCEAIVGPRPEYVDSEAALMAYRNDLYNRVRLLLAARLMRAAREDELTAALAICGVKVPPAPSAEARPGG